MVTINGWKFDFAQMMAYRNNSVEGVTKRLYKSIRHRGWSSPLDNYDMLRISINYGTVFTYYPGGPIPESHFFNPNFEGTFDEQIVKAYTDWQFEQQVLLAENTDIKKDSKGNPVVRKESPLTRYGIEIIQFVIKDIDFDQTIDALIQKKKEAEQMKVVARAQAEKAKQDAITAREQGAARIAVEKANQEVEKIKEVTIAQKNFEVSQLKRKQSEQDAQAAIVQGKAEAEVNKLKVQAGLTPLEKANIQKETAIGVAEQLAKVQFPGMMVLGGGSNGHATNPFDAVGLESFMRISDKLSKQKSQQSEE